MNITTATQGFAAIGSPARLSVLRTLVKAGEDGLVVGDIQTRTGIPASTLAHHLKALSAAQLITQSKDGRTITSVANYDRLTQLAGYILEECCINAKVPA